MALVNSIGAALIAAGKFVGRFTWGANLVGYLEVYKNDALEANSTITMFTPKKGEKYAGFGILAWGDNTQGITLVVGIPGAIDLFLAEIWVPTPADMVLLDAGAGGYFVEGHFTDIEALGYEFDGETPVIITQGQGYGPAPGTFKLLMAMIACN